jgi:hypothetical protein
MVNIYATYYIKPEFINIQNEKLNEYCTDNFRLNIINNGVDDKTKVNIKNICNDLNINCIDFNRPSHIPEYCSWSHSEAVEYVLDNYIRQDDKEDITVIIDSDVFPFKQFSFIELLNGNEVAGIHQQRLIGNINYEYLSAILIIFKNNIDLQNFNFRRGVGDTGAGTSYLIQKHETCYLKHTATIDIESDYIFQGIIDDFPYKKEYTCQFIDKSLIHYARGSNWNEIDPDYHNQKFNFVLNFLKYKDKYQINLDENVWYETAYTDKHYSGVAHNYKNYKFLDHDVSL